MTGGHTGGLSAEDRGIFVAGPGPVSLSHRLHPAPAPDFHAGQPEPAEVHPGGCRGPPCARGPALQHHPAGQPHHAQEGGEDQAGEDGGGGEDGGLQHDLPLHVLEPAPSASNTPEI